MSIIAVDPSLTCTGVAALGGLRTSPHWNVASIKCVKSMQPGERAEYRRMTDIAENLRTWIDMIIEPASRPDLFVIEAPAYSRHMGHAHERAGLWWHIYGMMVAFGSPVLTVKPNLRAKYATGKGMAGKDEVMLAAARRYPEASITNNDEADAVVLAAMGSRYLGNPVESLPGTHISAMKTLTA